MTDEQFKILIEKLDEMNSDLSSELRTINGTLETIASRVGRINDNDTTFKLLQKVKTEIEYINGKLD